MKRMFACAAMSILLATATALAQVSLSSTVDMALRGSNKVRIAEAEQARARGVLMEMHDAYIPNLTVGAGIGPSSGYPLEPPTVFNAASQSLVFSFSQSDYTRSARAALQAATYSLRDARQQVILDSATSYIELAMTTRKLAALNEAMADADQLSTIVQDRVSAGLDSRVEDTTAQLTRAQMDMQKIQLEDCADELRQHIANLTGLPAISISLDTQSIPSIPTLDLSASPNEFINPVLGASLANAQARNFTARGDELQNHRPSFQQVTQYGLYDTFQNYQQYYPHLRANFFGFEIQMTWPLFDPVRRAKGIESRAQAVSAQKEAAQTKIQLTENDSALQHRLRLLQAQQHVAELKQQLAQNTLDSVLTQMKNGSGSPNAPAVTPKQAEQARIDERSRYVDMLDAEFEVQRLQLELMRAAGTLENWVKQ